MSVSAILKNISQGALDKVLTGAAGDATTNATIKVTDPENGELAHHYVLQKAVLDSQNFAVGLDDNETIDLAFSAQIGGPDTTDQGLFYSGSNANNNVDYAGVGSFSPDRAFYYEKNNAIAPYNE